MIAECPKLIEDIMLTREYNPKVGVYQVRLCKDGNWKVVVIDDCLPIYRNGELVFSKVRYIDGCIRICYVQLHLSTVHVVTLWL